MKKIPSISMANLLRFKAIVCKIDHLDQPKYVKNT